ncbi:hypothetical protein C8Q74DRAFT_1451539 [Fomes fomentarius]|nr:hypothetical protein C8Q74DRAFT_1451539 [Fomes fomentarius]
MISQYPAAYPPHGSAYYQDPSTSNSNDLSMAWSAALYHQLKLEQEMVEYLNPEFLEASISSTNNILIPSSTWLSSPLQRDTLQLHTGYFPVSASASTIEDAYAEDSSDLQTGSDAYAYSDVLASISPYSQPSTPCIAPSLIDPGTPYSDNAISSNSSDGTVSRESTTSPISRRSASSSPPPSHHALYAASTPCIAPSLIYSDNATSSSSSDETVLRESTASPLASHRSVSSSPPPSHPSPSYANELIVCKRRNVQVSVPPSSASPPSSLRKGSVRNIWKCPHCPHVQRNKRKPDLKRHIATHTGSEDTTFVCCGVPVLAADKYGVPDKVLDEQPPWEFEGMLMVGGCRKTFSRKDAYGRHLKAMRGKCFGPAGDVPAR